MPFGESFNEFRDNGIFELHNTSLDLGELRELRQYLRENPIPPHRVPHYQFNLSNVNLVPISAPDNDEPLRGVISGRDHIIGRKESHVDHIIRQFVNVNPLGDINIYDRGRVSQLPANIEAVLFSVLNASEAWSVIKLNNVTTLSPKFIDKLLNSLQNNTHELVIKGAAFNNDAWIQFLSKKGSGLKVLGLELSEQDHDDDLQRLCEILVDHTKLKELDLGDTEITDYYYLDQLLYRNYCIEKMILKEPSDSASRVIYDKINQRLSTEITGKNRFELEQLTPKKTLNF